MSSVAMLENIGLVQKRLTAGRTWIWHGAVDAQACGGCHKIRCACHACKAMKAVFNYSAHSEYGLFQMSSMPRWHPTETLMEKLGASSDGYPSLPP